MTLDLNAIQKRAEAAVTIIYGARLPGKGALDLIDEDIPLLVECVREAYHLLKDLEWAEEEMQSPGGLRGKKDIERYKGIKKRQAEIMAKIKRSI